jgi:PAS domain S-box-containing protein
MRADRGMAAFESLPVPAVALTAIDGSLDLNQHARASAEIRRAADSRLKPILVGILRRPGHSEDWVELESGARLLVLSAPVRAASGRALGAVAVILESAASSPATAMAMHAPRSTLLVRDDDGIIVLANHAAERMFGYAAGELNGQHISILNGPADETPQERARAIFAALEENGSWDGDVHNVRKDGSSFWSHAEVIEFDDPTMGRLWFSTHTDVTSQHETDDDLRAAEARYRRAFQYAPAGIALTDGDLRVTDANAEFCRLAGLSIEELRGAAIESLIRPDADAPQPGDLWQQTGDGVVGGYQADGRIGSAAGAAVHVTIGLARDVRGAPQEGIVVVQAQEG